MTDSPMLYEMHMHTPMCHHAFGEPQDYAQVAEQRGLKGIVVTCQNERSQHKNLATAMKLLRAQLYKREMEKREAEKEQLHAAKKSTSFGSQIRSYILHPYQMVKDHRTDVETSNVDAVLDGDIDKFIDAYLLSLIEGRAEARPKG